MEASLLIYISILLALFFAAFLYVKTRKFGNPIYTYLGEYSYMTLGKQNEFFTEWVRFPAKKSSETAKKDLVFLFFCGNPGFIRFYDRFLSHLSAKYNKDYDVIGIGQAGQSLHKDATRKYFTLVEQVEHKLAFFNYLISLEEYKDSKFVFVGHSFGCYTALKVMNSIAAKYIQYAMFVHPAFDRLVETPNGKHRMSLHSISFLFPPVFRFFSSIAPHSLRRYIASLAFEEHQNGEGIADCVETLAGWLSNYHLSMSFFALTLYQFREICLLPEEDIHAFSGKITVSYALNDDWTPDKQKYEFRDRFSKHTIFHECEQGLTHTFVAGASQLQVNAIYELLKGKLGK